LERLRHLTIENRDHVTNEVRIITKQTLAPNFNENALIIDFLDTINDLSAMDVPAPPGINPYHTH
jgi:hypothetical protein